LNPNEVEKTFEIIKQAWNQLFEIVRFHMERGIEIVEKNRQKVP
jgi:hypothetical protein